MSEAVMSDSQPRPTITQFYAKMLKSGKIPAERIEEFLEEFFAARVAEFETQLNAVFDAKMATAQAALQQQEKASQKILAPDGSKAAEQPSIVVPKLVMTDGE